MIVPKKWYQSKTKLTAIVTGLIMIADAFGIKIPAELYGALGSFGLYSLRDAIK